MKWLFATYSFPWPIIHGSWLRVYHLARSLTYLGAEVHLLSRGSSDPGIEAYRTLGVAVSTFTCGEAGGLGRGRSALSPYVFEEEWVDPIRSHCQDVEVAVLFGARMMQYAPEASCGCHVLVDMVDDPLREHRRRMQSPGVIDWLRWAKLSAGQKRYERKFRKSTDATIFVSEADCEGFRSRNPGSSSYCVPNGVDTEAFLRPEDLASDKRCPSVVFLGNMANPNNERAAMHLVQEVGPKLWQLAPEARIVLVGAGPTQRLRAMASERVSVTGEVPDVREHLWDASVAAIPMVSGTGIKNKVLEAWAASVPVVATPLAVEGIREANADNCMIRESPVEFAEAIYHLLRDPLRGQKLGLAGRKTVERFYSWSKPSERLLEIAESIMQSQRSSWNRPCT